MRKLPLTRNTDIVVQEMGNEVLIYDLNNHQAYNLNETLTTIYQACDGKTTFDELKAANKFTDEIIFLALDELKNRSLLEENQLYNLPLSGMTRREMIRRVGLTSLIAFPLISSIVVPTAAQASSHVPTCPSISPCNNNVSIPRGCPCTLNCSNCAGSNCNTISGVCE